MAKRQKGRGITNTQLFTIIGLVVMVAALPLILVVLRLVLDASSLADEETLPNEVVVSNISDTHATISWFTNTEAEGYVKYGTSETSLNLIASDIRDLGKDSSFSYKQHIVEISNLSPGTKYYFQVYSNGLAATNAPGAFTTDATSSEVQLPRTYKGKVNVERAYLPVYAFASNGTTVSEVRSSYTASNGTFTFDLSKLQTQSGSAEFSLEDSKVVVYVNGLDDGRARVIVDPTEDGIISMSLEESNIAFTQNVDITNPIAQDPIDEEPVDEEPSTPPSDEDTETPSDTAFGIDIMNNQYSNSSSTTNPYIPTKIFVSNSTETSFQLNWVTLVPTRGYLVYGENSLDKKVLDARDSNPNTRRYTHTVRVSDGSWVAGDIIQFKISSEGDLYGADGGTASYEYVVPAVLSSPPQPSALEGELDLLSGSKMSTRYRDYIIYAKVRNSSGTSSAYVSTVPALNSTGWSLPVGNARNQSLTGSITPAEVSLYVVGEYNSLAQKEVTDLDSVVNISMVPGPSVDNVSHKGSYPTVPKIKGTAKPNSTVTLTLDSQTYTVQSDVNGDWEYTPAQLSQGEHTLGIDTSTGSFLITYEIGLDVLPETALDPALLSYITGIVVLLLGLYTVYYSRKYA